MKLSLYQPLVMGFAAVMSVCLATHLWRAGSWNWNYFGTLLFLCINIFVCYLEALLLIRGKQIQDDYRLLSDSKGHELGCIGTQFVKEISFGEFFLPQNWTRLWAAYSTIDGSYIEPTSFGYWADSGNGLSTIVPSVLLLINVTFPPFLSARLMGVIALASSWQMLYGCIIYLLAYFVRRRYTGPSHAVHSFVVTLNGIWIVFPAWIIRCCWMMIQSNSYGVFM
ncbi:hypothetical protein PAPYR_6334 [Paratrimastix pyriformis]|uniref:Integral membrane protein n=1 Tax=Paratrimastix pyriformis TaxID=342808 RepID=A0ABQ8UFL1_9EUKA|nr:hypothetical protein PAPYR_6334 [Paratrimastix pyriformis]